MSRVPTILNIVVKEGGTETVDNLILLCPNHHKEAHNGIISQSQLQKLTYKNDEEADEQLMKIKLKASYETSLLIDKAF